MPPAPDPARVHFFGGKGGVGKTTCAAGVAAAAAAAGTRTLVLSTDPAPSLGDAFGRRLAAVPRRVAGARTPLFAAEIDAPRALDRWLVRRRATLERIALRGTWLDAEDVARLLRLSLPGIDEIAALVELSRLARSGRFELIVVDTAPTGHTLRMLAMPETLLGLARLFDRMQAKHRVMVEALRGRWTPEEDDRVIDGMAEEASALAALLRDEARTSMSWVTLAEPMAVEETLDAAAAMSARGIRLREVVFNRVTAPPPGPCRWCDARRRFERGAIATLRRRLGRGSAAPALRTVAAREAEPTGLRALLSVGREATALPTEPSWGAGAFAGKGAAPSGGGRRVVAVADLERRGGAIRIAETATLVMFGGKGGVGKTTCAAAEAIAMAAADSGRRVLLLSADPAHSLADALGVPLADTPRRLPGAPRNLLARELDSSAQFARVRDRYSAAIDALFERLTRGSAVDAAQDRRVMRDLIDLAPPGVDELAAVIDVVDALEAGAGDLIVLDTAPSGHALRLLEMPAIVQEWTHALMAILLKYQPVAGIGELGSLLLKLSQGIGRLRAQLADVDRTRFIVVTRAAAVVRAESVRLAARLDALHIAVPVVVVNALGAGDCARCRRQRAAERREVARLRRALSGSRAGARLAAAPAWMPPPHGRAALAEWRRAWRALP